MCVWAHPCDCRGYRASRIEFRLQLCVLVTVEILLHQPAHEPAKSVLGDEKKWFSWRGFPGESVWKLLHLVLTAERCVCLYSCICQHVCADVRWNTNNIVIGEIKLAFWERQARSCYFACPPSSSASLNFYPFHLPLCAVLFHHSSLCQKRNACYFLLCPQFGVKSPWRVVD